MNHGRSMATDTIIWIRLSFGTRFVLGLVVEAGVGVSLCFRAVEPSSIDPRCTCTRNKLQQLRSNLVSTTHTGTCRGTKSLFVRGKGWFANPIDATRRYCTALHLH